MLIHNPGRWSGPWLAAGLLAVALTACDSAAPGQVAALATENARLGEQVAALSTQVAQLQAEVGGDTLVTAGEGKVPTPVAVLPIPPTPAEQPTSPVMAAAESPLPTPTFTPRPPPTPFPTFVPETLTGEPPSGFYAPADTFAERWSTDETAGQALGWAAEAEPARLDLVMQPFERGYMIWRSDTREVYVLYADSTWENFLDTFEEGMPESDPAFAGHANFEQPMRGFGKIWRENTDLRERIGWAIQREAPYDGLAQRFQRGSALQTGVFTFYIGQLPDGTPVWYP